MFQRHSVNGLTYFTFSELTAEGVNHVIGSRLGGVSGEPFSTLNMSFSVGDDPNRVQENRNRLAQLVGVTAADLVGAWLTHGNDVARVNREHRGQYIPYHDGLITDEPGVPLFMTFADCVPIILHDPKHHAVGLLHAGWRGTAAGIVAQAVARMEEEFGTHPEDLTMAFGPAIGTCHYEVGPDVMEAFQTLGRTPPVFQPGSNGHVHLDLIATNKHQAMALGVERFLESAYCTACHTDLFYSHRAEGGKTGRFGVIVMLAE